MYGVSDDYAEKQEARKRLQEAARRDFWTSRDVIGIPLFWVAVHVAVCCAALGEWIDADAQMDVWLRVLCGFIASATEHFFKWAFCFNEQVATAVEKGVWVGQDENGYWIHRNGNRYIRQQGRPAIEIIPDLHS